MTKEKYALFDTDFISKTHLIRKDDQSKMIDRVMEMNGYHFFCHEQIKAELKRHNVGNCYKWLEARISDESVHCISDKQILDELYSIYSDSAQIMYVNMLQAGCEAYKKGYFEENFTRLQSLDCQLISKESFLQELENDCEKIGAGKNLGELKSYVLLQMLNIKFGEQIYVFCSDDKNARNGIISLGNARCINILSTFMRLDKEGILHKQAAEPYIQAYLKECWKHKQTAFKIHEASKHMRMCKIPCEEVFEMMYAGSLELLQNGDLRKKQ